MKIKINRESLSQKLNNLVRIVPKKSLVNATDFFLLDIGEDGVSIYATDMDRFMSTFISGSISGEGSSRICIEAKTSTNIVDNLSSEDVTLNFEEDHLMITGGKSKYKVPILGGDDFLKIPSVSDDAFSFSTQADAFKDKLIRCENSVQRTNMNVPQEGVHIISKGGQIYLEATNSHVLTKQAVHSNCEGLDLNLPPNLSPMIHGEILEVSVTDSRIFFSGGGYHGSATPLNIKYPDVDRVIGEEPQGYIELDRMELISALNRISLTSGASKECCLSVGEAAITLSSQDNETNRRGSEELECSVNLSPLDIGLNTEYLIKILNNLEGEKICMMMDNPRKRVIVRGEGKDQMWLIMPVAL